MFFNSFNVMKLAMDIDEIAGKVLEESSYIEAATDNGYPQYTREEAVTAAEALEDEEDLEILRKLSDGEGLHDIYYTDIGEDLDRLEEAEMIERPSTGEELVKLTRLSQTYLQYYGKMNGMSVE